MSARPGGRRRPELLRMSAKASGKLDWARDPLSACFWWGLPLAIGAADMLMHPPLRVEAGICSILFFWMSAGCLLNARRCHRVHCYIAGPLLLLAAVFTALVAAGVLEPGLRAFDNAVGIFLVLTLLSFVPEWVWKRYA